jgi:cell division protein ZipA
MAAELRLILLGLGVALVVGLWWWERRRSAGTSVDGPVRDLDAFEPRLDAEPHASVPRLERADAEPHMIETDTQEMPARRPPVLDRPVLDRPVPRGDPPVITIDGLPEETIEVVLEEPVKPAAEAAGARAGRSTRAGADRRRPVTDPPVVEIPEAVVEAPAEPAAELPPAETPPRHQRIIAVRLLGRDNQRIEGRELKAALGSEGLEFGRYAIFHRIVDGGRPLYSVASLVEPGSFDPNLMESLRFPGISMFAVFPGPLPAPQCFDELLATARRLADRLGATLQDDSGSSLTGQRVLSIREDLVHFEHLVSLSRSRPRA